jgi:hypothetical protein
MRHRLLTPLLVVALLAGTASCKLAGRAFGPQDEGGRGPRAEKRRPARTH